MFSVALVGAGRIGGIRARIIQSSDDAVLRAVADVDAARAEALAREAGAMAAPDWRGVVTSPQVDLVVVSTPTKFHQEIAITALEAGKHVLCEKPLARNIQEAERMVKAACSAGRILKTGFNYRHMAHVRKAKELIEAGRLGPLYFLRCRYGHGGRPGYEKDWCTDHELSGGGVLLEQGIHILDLVRYLFAEPSALVAQIQRFFWAFPVVEDNCFCLLQSEAGQSAQIHVSWTQWINLLHLEIFGRDGYLQLEGRDGHYGRQRLTWGKRKATHGRPDEEVFEFSPEDQSWQWEWREFLDAVRQGREPLANGWEGLRAQSLVEAAYRSATDGIWVKIPPFEAPVRKP